MIREPSEFRDIADNAQLTAKEMDHFTGGMTGVAEDLTLSRKSYTLLQAFLERGILESLPMDYAPQGYEPRPFAYATPKPLTPLYISSHPRHRASGIMFRKLLAVSVMNDAVFRRTVEEDMLAGREISLAAGGGFHNGGDIFSTTLEDIQAPRMAMHLERENGPVRVAFIASQHPETTEGRVVFGDEASAMYREIVALHEKNVKEGRGAEYVYRTITGQELRV